MYLLFLVLSTGFVQSRICITQTSIDQHKQVICAKYILYAKNIVKCCHIIMNKGGQFCES